MTADRFAIVKAASGFACENGAVAAAHRRVPLQYFLMKLVGTRPVVRLDCAQTMHLVRAGGLARMIVMGFAAF